MAKRLHCYICDGRFPARTMSRIDGEENAAKLGIAVHRRDAFNRPPLENVKSCEHHLDDRGFLLPPLLLGLRFINRPYVIRGLELQIFLQALRDVARTMTRIDDENSLTDEEFECFCPISKDQFRELFTYCDRIPHEGGHRYVGKKELLMFLCKMRQGLSDEFLCAMFQYPSRQATSLAIATKMAKRLHCYICDGRFPARTMSRIDGEENAAKLGIAVHRRDAFNRPPLENVKSCEHHLDDRGFLLPPLLLGLRFINRPYVIRGLELQIFLQALRDVARTMTRIDDENSLTDEEFECFCPISKDQFRELFTYCDRIPHEGGHRYVGKKELLMFLCKMRQGLSDEFLCAMFQYPSRQATSLAIATVRQSLMQLFVPANIDAITRENYIARHVTEFANELWQNQPSYIPTVVDIEQLEDEEEEENENHIQGYYCTCQKITRPAITPQLSASIS
ncbi:hypothetical protein TSAR_008926 [Trichomalopsis sarcophagae]|uniref:Uncharacterized protein n=1 Tax=Trichomalopsis sarcophagae TaxID=543379 RepID=A0A232EDT5_9HYME|nr:hypothetical protein TSAR_008926 [Trichomalopsis sarcophagae]